MSKVIDINLKGSYMGLKHVLKVMVEQKSGAIVNTSSIGGYKGGLPLTSAYIASKHGVSGITKAAAVEYARSGVRVNAVCPGPVNSELMRIGERTLSPDDPDKAREMMSNDIPMGRYAEPHEIADAVLFLASDKASFITGVTLLVDGGLCT
jgi:NAD(P)-dependent dehydrogenase (short-subunit alcohol dehydrogenase family)